MNNDGKCVSLKNIVKLQIAVLLFSLVGVISKIASKILEQDGMLNLKFFLCLTIMFILLGLYAITWQRILKKVDLSIAYINKAMSLMWTLIWSIILFNETITLNNVIGIAIIIFGILVVTKHD
jgi:drug/metabolite transporter (DMT)-like permease